MTLVRIFGAACLLAVLSGCYQAHVAVIDDGVAVPFGDVATCQIGEKPFRFDLTHPERTAGGGTVYHLGNETLAFKPLTDTLYLTQLNSSGLYRYGYVLRNGETLEVLALNQDIQTDPIVRPSAANVLFKPAPNGWQEIIGAQADLKVFLTGAKLGMMHSVGQCTFRKVVSPDALLINNLTLSMTREQALKLPGAEACELGDVCLPLLPSLAGQISESERASIRFQAAFDPSRIHSVTVTGKELSPKSAAIFLDSMKLGSSRVGPYDLPLSLNYKNQRIDILEIKRQSGADPQQISALMRLSEKLKDFRTGIGDPTFRLAELLVLPAETFSNIKNSANAEAALANLRMRNEPYERIMLKQTDGGKLDFLIELIP